MVGVEPPAFDSPCPSLSDSAVRLRAWQVSDAADLERHCQDPFIQRFTRVPSPYGRADAEGFIARAIHQAVARRAYHLCLSPRDSDTVMGAVGAEPISDIEVEMGYWIARDYRGLGLATRALTLATDWVLANRQAGRAVLLISPENDRSQRVASKAGYVPTDIASCHVRGSDVEAIRWVRVATPFNTVINHRSVVEPRGTRS